MTPGAIVCHTDYPQWGHGYVIRARKKATDVFFLWGGRRTVADGEPLEESRAPGAQAALEDDALWQTGIETDVESEPVVIDVATGEHRFRQSLQRIDCHARIDVVELCRVDVARQALATG